VPVIPRIVGIPRHRMPMGPLALRKFAKGAGTILLGVIALDLLATLITIAVGAETLKR
jgi:hypothetical protein